jgi:hypothetical protein
MFSTQRFPALALLFFSLLRTNFAQLVVGSTGPGCTDAPGTDPRDFDANGAGNLLSDLLAATGAPANWFAGVFVFDNFAFATGSAAGCTDLSGNTGGCALPVGPDGTTCELVNQTFFDSVSQTSVIETPETGKLDSMRFKCCRADRFSRACGKILYQRLCILEGYEPGCS